MPLLQLIRSASVHPSNYVVTDSNLASGASEEEAFTASKYRMEICWLILSLIAVTIHLFLGMVVFETLTRCEYCNKAFIQVVCFIGVFCAM